MVTRLDDGAEEWLTEGPALEAVLASAALPAIFPSVELEGKRYIDGGVVDNTPLSVALAAGARRIYVLLCGGVQRPSVDVRAALRGHARGLRACRFARGFAEISPRSRRTST